MTKAVLLTSSLLFATVVIALDRKIQNDAMDKSTENGNAICSREILEQKVILNCSGVAVQKELFTGLDHNMNVLDISYTSLSTLSVFSTLNEDTFKHLIVLNASHNSIQTVEEDSFKIFLNLEKLDLSFNNIESLSDSVFVSMSDLRFLDLSNNRLVSLPRELPMTDWLDVSYNQISSIHETYSSVLYPQTVFLLGNNPFKCTCDLLWLKELFSTRLYLLKFVANLDPKKFIPACSSPENLAGKSWDTLEDNEFKCTQLDENNFESANEKIAYKLKEEVKVTASEIGPDWVLLHWNGNSEHSGKVIEIKYHKFGDSSDKKLVILPLSASGYRLRNLEINAPYVICFTVVLEMDSKSLGCEEIVTAKHPDISSFSKIYEFVIRMFTDYSNHLIVLLILFITTMYIIERKGENKDDKK